MRPGLPVSSLEGLDAANPAVAGHRRVLDPGGDANALTSGQRQAVEADRPLDHEEALGTGMAVAAEDRASPRRPRQGVQTGGAQRLLRRRRDVEALDHEANVQHPAPRSGQGGIDVLLHAAALEGLGMRSVLRCARTIEPSLVLQPNLLPHPATTPEVVSEFVERSTETGRGSDVSEPPHRVLARCLTPRWSCSKRLLR
jgi:hypothetical protein